MTVSRIPSRMLRDAAIDADDGQLLADFTMTLLDCLEVPEIRDAVLAALGIPAPAPIVQTPVPRPTPSGRGIRRR